MRDQQVPVAWYVYSKYCMPFQKTSADGELVDRDGKAPAMDTLDVTTSTAPSMLTLMRMMSEQIAAQREAIAELKAERSVFGDQAAEICDLKTLVRNQSDQLASQAGVIELLKALQQTQDNTIEVLNTANVARIQEIRQLKLKDDIHLESINNLGAGKANRCLIEKLQAQISAHVTAGDNFKSEIASLRSANAALQDKIETLLEMQKLQRSTNTAHQGLLDSLDGFVRARLHGFDSSITTLMVRLTAAENENVSLSKKTNEQLSTLEEQIKTKEIELKDELNTLKNFIARTTGEAMTLAKATRTTFAEFESRAKADMAKVVDEFENRMSALRSNLKNEVKKIDSFLLNQKASRKLQMHLENSITGLTASLKGLEVMIDVVKSEMEGLKSRFSYELEFKELKERFDSQETVFDAVCQDIANSNKKTIPKIQKNISTLVKTVKEHDTSISTLSAGLSDMESKSERITFFEKELNSVCLGLSAAKDVMDEVKVIQSEDRTKMNDAIADNYETLTNKIDSEITKLCFHNSLEPSPDDEFEGNHPSSSCGTDKGSSDSISDLKDDDVDGLFDPYGNDCSSRRFCDGTEQNGYFESYEEEDRHCGKCGNDVEDEDDEGRFDMCKVCREKEKAAKAKAKTKVKGGAAQGVVDAEGPLINY